MDCWYLLILTASLCCIKDINATTYTMFVNGYHVTSPNGVRIVSPAEEITVTCSVTTSNDDVTLFRIINGQGNDLSDYLVNTIRNDMTNWTYHLNKTDKQHSSTTYRCMEKSSVSCPHYVQVTIYFNSESTPPGPTIPNCAPSTSADSPSVIPPSTQSPSSSGGTSGPKFAGLNPLIYTISAVILLGTLAIVAIVTCWIRARRSYNRRMFQATTNPQDYLDYISDNEFTPLTSHEFAASLQERPPTYHESEEIEGQTRPQEDGEGGGEGDGAGERGGGGGDSSGNRQSTSSRAPPPRPPPPPPTTTNTTDPQPTQQSRSSTTRSTPPVDVATTTTTPNIISLSPPPPGRHGDQADRPSDNSQQSSYPVETNEDAPVVNDGVTSADISSVLSGVDALLSGDFGNWNETQQEFRSDSHHNPPLDESASIGTLIDFGYPNQSLLASSDSQSTFHSLPHPTPEQISEIDASVGAVTEPMTHIRERTE